MASTNKTINYNLSQYLANDKPTYLGDYNSDMNKIDTQMKANSDLAGLAKSEADDLSSRIDGQDVVIGTLNTTVGEHTSDINELNTNVSNINTKVGDLSNLNTTDKTNIVSAVNEVNIKVGDLTDLDTSDKTDVISAVNEVNTKVSNLENKKEVYSTTEVLTNKIWIDNKPVYRKVVSGSIANDLNLDLSNVTITNVEGHLITGSGVVEPLPVLRTNNPRFNVGYYIRPSNQVIWEKGEDAQGTAYITVEYTKNI